MQSSNLKNFFGDGECNRGFTLIELLVVISILGLMASVIFASLNEAKLKSRDARRLVDMREVHGALNLYYDAFGAYPPSDGAGCGGWDSTGNGTFLTPLVTNGFLRSHVIDLTINDTCGNYAYARYGAGSNGCDASRGSFIVFGVRDMETSARPHPKSPGWSCSGRNWGAEFDWVMGIYEH